MTRSANIVLQKVIIAQDASVSSSCDLRYGELCGIYVPSAITGDSFLMEASSDDETYGTIHAAGAGTALYATMPLTADDYFAVTPSELKGAAFVRITSDETEAGERTFLFAYKQSQ